MLPFFDQMICNLSTHVNFSSTKTTYMPHMTCSLREYRHVMKGATMKPIIVFNIPYAFAPNVKFIFNNLHWWFNYLYFDVIYQIATAVVYYFSNLA